jgi:chemotaxis protein MotB
MIRKKKKSHDHENSERWLVSYADFITLLFAFFVVMYATSTNNVEKQKQFESSVRVNLHLAQGASAGGTSPTAAITEAIQELAEPVDKFPKTGSPKEIKDYLNRQIDKGGDGLLKASVTGVKHEWYGVRVSLAASSFFPAGAYKLKLSSLKIIDELVQHLDGSNSRLIIEGHTDDIPIKNDFVESNWELSSLRASSVVRYLIKYHGFAPSKITAAAYADTKPLVPNTSEENRSKNRRIDILIISDERMNSEGF